MRRSRIKVMPTVPAKRKPAKDAWGEKDERPDTTEADSRAADVTGGAESQEAIVHRVKEETKENFIQAVDWSMTANELETDTARVFGVSPALVKVEASEGERAAVKRESQAIWASSEEDCARETAESKGSGAPDHAPMAKQPSQTRTTDNPNKTGRTLRPRRAVERPPNVTTAAKTTPARSRRKKPINFSESVEKLAKARREFRLKYKYKKPDITKLTMYDLIFFNPIKKTNNAGTNAPTSNAPPPASPVEDEDEFGAGEMMPVPQVKVKPDECDAGELTLEPQAKVKSDEYDAGELTPVPQVKVKPDEYDAGELTLEPQVKVEPMPVPQAKVKPDEYDAGELTLVPQAKVEPDDFDAGKLTLVPQVKVEPDDCDAGELTLVPQVEVESDDRLVFHERSLVVEETGAQKSRQAFARIEDLVCEISNGSGLTKRGQKARDWTKRETLKFYKALNTVGTDFSLMQTFFPERTRREIQLKYKREDKFNRSKVEKALVHHTEFNMESL